MLHTDTVDAVALELLTRVQRNTAFADTRLAGGTALALQIGHRRSVDLDFFGHVDMAQMGVEQELRECGPVSVRNRSKHIQGYTVCGIHVDLVEYPYPWLEAPVVSGGLRLASCRDIAAMKLSAITNRGTKKDFIDLAFLLDMFGLADMLKAYAEKFTDGGLFMVVKSLAYFEDAEEDPMPNMLRPCDWSGAKQRIAREVARISGGDGPESARQRSLP